MAASHRFNDPAETTMKLTVIVPTDLDRQLRALAFRQGIGVGPMIRGWLIAKLAGAERVASAGTRSLSVMGNDRCD